MLAIYLFFKSKKPFNEILLEVESMNYLQYKTHLADLLIAKLAPIQKKFYLLMENRDFITKTLCDGAKSAEKIANKQLKEILECAGLFGRL